MKNCLASLSTFGLEIDVSNVGKMAKSGAERNIVKNCSQGSSQIIQLASEKGSFFAIPTHLGSCLRNLALHHLTLTTSNSGEWKNNKSCFFIFGPVMKVRRFHFFQRRAC